MLTLALIFFIIALMAGALGFWIVAGTLAFIAKFLFFIFLICFLVSFLASRRPPL